MSRTYFSGSGFADNLPKPLNGIHDFATFVQRWLSKPVINHLTSEEYHKLTKPQQSEAKNSLYFCAGVFGGDGKRRAYNVTHLNLLVLDIDKPDAARTILSAPLDDLLPWPFALWRTLTSTEASPRVRLVVDADNLTPEEYRAGVEWLAARLGVEMADVDPHSLDISHLWFVPACFRDQQGAVPIVASRPTGPPLTPAEWQETPVAPESEASEPLVSLPASDVSLEDAEEMLGLLKPDDPPYWGWVRPLCAIKHQFGDAGFDIFDQWSSKGDKYPGTAAVRRKWKAFKAIPTSHEPITIRSLVGMAKAQGWSPDTHKRVLALETLIDGSDRQALTGSVLQAIHDSPYLSTIQVHTLLGLVQTRLKRLHAPVRSSAIREAYDALDAAPAAGAVTPEEFQGYVYVRENDQWVHPAKGSRLTPAAFDRSFSESTSYALQTLKLPVVDREGYDPRQTDMIYTNPEGLVVLNAYRQSYPEADASHAPEAAGIFNKHLEMLFPSARSRDLLLSWMTWCLLHPGEKVRWHIFMQGAPGCGKSLIAEALATSFGSTNSRKVTNGMLTEKFNNWIPNCLFAYFEEILLGERQKDTMEVIKDLVTGTTATVRAMRKDYMEMANMLNGMFLSNHDHGLRLERGDRRFFCLRCAFQHKHQVEAIPRAHFEQFARLKTDLAGGLRHYLLHRSISPDFDPFGHAPHTSDRDIVMRAGASEVDAAVLTAIEEGGNPAVGKDVLSSTTLHSLVRDELRFVTGKQIARVLVDMGYVKAGQRELVNDERHTIWYNPSLIVNGAMPINVINARIEAK